MNNNLLFIRVFAAFNGHCLLFSVLRSDTTVIFIQRVKSTNNLGLQTLINFLKS